ncbi:MAG: hypothetical protein WD042_03050 [Phycisphaeraceae bacterium]
MPFGRNDSPVSDVLYLERPRCPACESPDLRTLRSVANQGDGSTRRRTVCKSCGHRFSIVIE